MKKFSVLYYNRFANENQIFRVMAENAYRAGRLFYLKHNRKAYFDCIEFISEDTQHHYWTEEEIKEKANR